jgi:uncharacterized protein YkwD
MRKPLVVVCVGASAVLLAGAIAATAAGAGTTPDVPQAPGAAVPVVPQLPAAADGDVPQAPAQPAPAGGGVPQVPAPDLPGVVAPDQRPATPADPDDKPQRPGGQTRPDADPVRPKPAQDDPDRDRPAPQKPVKQAQQDVTPDTGAGSVSSPVQQQVLALVNENRRRGGCDDLTLDRRLIDAANRHAADMARRGYFAHRSPSGTDAGERVEDAGYRWSRYGENIARGQESVREVVDGWMHSPEHRENIMDCGLHQMGVGLAFASDRTPYWVQDFATPL